MKLRIAIATACLLSATAAQATVMYQQISGGTGFFINRNGHLITNAHVVQACQSINILTKAGERPATLIASDREQDLALLKATDMGGSEVAPLRWNIRDLQVGDSVNVLGFPGEEGYKGHYSYKKTNVMSLEGPAGDPRWIQLGSVVQKGNSGGPVLDGTGNVIAVISGVAQKFKVDSNGNIEPAVIGQSDVAITLATLQDFLHRNAVSYYESSSGLVAYADGAIEQNAATFTVPVRCVKGSYTR